MAGKKGKKGINDAPSVVKAIQQGVREGVQFAINEADKLDAKAAKAAEQQGTAVAAEVASGYMVGTSRVTANTFASPIDLSKGLTSNITKSFEKAIAHLPDNTKLAKALGSYQYGRSKTPISDIDKIAIQSVYKGQKLLEEYDLSIKNIAKLNDYNEQDSQELAKLINARMNAEQAMIRTLDNMSNAGKAFVNEMQSGKKFSFGKILGNEKTVQKAIENSTIKSIEEFQKQALERFDAENKKGGFAKKRYVKSVGKTRYANEEFFKIGPDKELVNKQVQAFKESKKDTTGNIKIPKLRGDEAIAFLKAYDQLTSEQLAQMVEGDEAAMRHLKETRDTIFNSKTNIHSGVYRRLYGVGKRIRETDVGGFGKTEKYAKKVKVLEPFSVKDNAKPNYTKLQDENTDIGKVYARYKKDFNKVRETLAPRLLTPEAIDQYSKLAKSVEERIGKGVDYLTAFKELQQGLKSLDFLDGSGFKAVNNEIQTIINKEQELITKQLESTKSEEKKAKIKANLPTVQKTGLNYTKEQIGANADAKEFLGRTKLITDYFTPGSKATRIRDKVKQDAYQYLQNQILNEIMAGKMTAKDALQSFSGRLGETGISKSSIDGYVNSIVSEEGWLQLQSKIASKSSNVASQNKIEASTHIENADAIKQEIVAEEKLLEVKKEEANVSGIKAEIEQETSIINQQTDALNQNTQAQEQNNNAKKKTARKSKPKKSDDSEKPPSSTPQLLPSSSEPTMPRELRRPNFVRGPSNLKARWGRRKPNFQIDEIERLNDGSFSLTGHNKYGKNGKFKTSVRKYGYSAEGEGLERLFSRDKNRIGARSEAEAKAEAKSLAEYNKQYDQMIAKLEQIAGLRQKILQAEARGNIVQKEGLKENLPRLINEYNQLYDSVSQSKFAGTKDWSHESDWYQKSRLAFGSPSYKSETTKAAIAVEQAKSLAEVNKQYDQMIAKLEQIYSLRNNLAVAKASGKESDVLGITEGINKATQEYKQLYSQVRANPLSDQLDWSKWQTKANEAYGMYGLKDSTVAKVQEINAKQQEAYNRAEAKALADFNKQYDQMIAKLEQIASIHQKIHQAEATGNIVQAARLKEGLPTLIQDYHKLYDSVSTSKYAGTKDWSEGSEFAEKRSFAFGRASYDNEATQATITVERLKELKVAYADLIKMIQQYARLKDQGGAVGKQFYNDIGEQYKSIENMKSMLSGKGVDKDIASMEQKALNTLNSSMWSEGAKAADSYISKINQVEKELKALGLFTEKIGDQFNQARNRLYDIANQNVNYADYQEYIKRIHAQGQIELFNGGEYITPLSHYQDLIKSHTQINAASDILSTTKGKLAGWQNLVGLSDEASFKINELNQKVLELESTLARASSTDTADDDLRKLAVAMQELSTATEKAVGARGYTFTGTKNGLFSPGHVTNINQAKQALKAYAAEQDYVLQTSLKVNSANNTLVGTYKTVGGRLATITGQFNAQGKSLNIISSQMNGQSSIFGDLAGSFGNFFKMYFTTFTVVPRVMSAIRSGFTEFQNYNKALLNISYTMDLSKQQLNDLGESALASARKLGIAVSDMESIYQVYANQTITMEQLAQQAAPTAVLSNLAGEEASVAADQIQAVMNQFDLLAGDDSPENFARQAEHIVDVMDLISQNLALDYQKGISVISEATEVAGATAKQAGMSFEQLAAIAGTAAETTRQEGSSIGNALKTIMVRTSKASKYAGDDEIDNATLSNASKALHGIGVEVYKQGGEYREFDVIMSELADKWDSLSDAQKANISFAIAATRQTNLLSVVLKNYKESTELATRATNEHGSAMKNQEKYLASTAGHLKTLGASVSTLWIRIFQSMPINAITGVLAQITKLLAFGAEKAPVLTTLVTAFAGARLITGGRSFIGSLQGELAGAIGLAGKLQAILNSIRVFGMSAGAVPSWFKGSKDVLTAAGMSTSIGAVIKEAITGSVRSSSSQVVSKGTMGLTDSIASALMAQGVLTQGTEAGKYNVKSGANFKGVQKQLREKGGLQNKRAANWIDRQVTKGTIQANGQLAKSSIEATIAMEGETAAAAGLSGAMSGLLMVAGSLAVAVGSLALIGYFNDADTRAYEKATENLEKYRSKLDEVKQKIEEYNSIRDHRELNTAEKNRISLLEDEQRRLETLIKLNKILAIENARGSYQRDMSGASWSERTMSKLLGESKGDDAFIIDSNKLDSLNKQFKNGQITNEEYKESAQDIVTTMTDWMETTDLLRDENGNLDQELELIYEQAQALVDVYLDNVSAMESSSEATSNYQSNVSALSNTFYDLRNEVLGAKSAADDLKKSLDEINNEGDALGTYKEVMTDAIEDAKDTVDGTRKFWTVAESTLGEDRLKEIDYDFDTAYKEMKKLNKLTDGTAESTYDFYDQLYKKRDKLAKLGVTVTKDANGTITWDGIDSENIAKVADKMNWSVDVLEALFDAAGRWSEIDWSDSFSDKGKGNKKSKKKAMKKLARSKENTGSEIYEQYDKTPEGKKKYKYKNKYVWADATRQQVISQGTSRDWYKKGGARDQFVRTAGGEQYLLSFNKRDYNDPKQFLENLNAFSEQLDKDLKDAGEDLGEFGYSYAKKIDGVQHYNSIGMTYQMQNAGKTSSEIAEWFYDALDKGGVIDFFDQEGKAQTVTKDNLDELAQEAGYGTDVDKYLAEIVSGLNSENIDIQAGTVILNANSVKNPRDEDVPPGDNKPPQLGSGNGTIPEDGLSPHTLGQPLTQDEKDKYNYDGYIGALNDLDDVLTQAEELGYDFKKTDFGNVDLDDPKRLIEWSDKTIEANQGILDKWGLQFQPGDTSTVSGSWGNYGKEGTPIAFSPINIGEDGNAQLLDPDVVDGYIDSIVSQLESEGKPVNLDNVLALDSTGTIKGFEGIKNIIADVGDTSATTAEQMHFAGVNGAIQQTVNKVKDLEDAVPDKLRTDYKLNGIKESKLSVDDYKKAVSTIPERVSTTITAFVSQAKSALQDVLTKLGLIKDKEVTVTTTKKTKNENSNTGAHKGGGNTGDSSSNNQSHKKKNTGATGGKARGGWTLTGELGRELVWSGNYSYLVGEDHPEMVYLKKGDYIYPNRETEEIMRGNPHRSVFASRATGDMPMPKTSSSGSGSGKNKKKKKKKKKKNGSKSKSSSSQFNWIERSIQKIEYEIDKLSQKAENAHNTFATRAKATADELKKVTTEIKEQQQAVKDYTSKANKVTYTKGKGKKKKEVALPDKYKKLVESGRYDIDKNGNIKDKKNGKIIETVKGSLADAIKEYQDYIDKVRDAEKQIAELQEKRLDLAAQKLDLIESKYDGIISVIEGRVNAAEKANELLESQGKMMTQNYYQIQIQGTNDKLAQQKKELVELQNALKAYEKTPGANKNSEEWYNLNKQILDCKDAIADTTIKVNELKKAMRQLSWDIFDQAQEYLTNMPEEFQFMIDTISHRGLYYDLNTFWDNDYLQGREVDYTDMQGRIGEYRNIGRLNERGLAVGALYFTKYEAYVKQAEQLGDAVAELNEQIYNQTDYDKELVYHRNELLEQQQQAISNALSEKEAIKDLVSEGYGKMIDALDTLIDKRKDALQATKDLYDYQNDIEEQTTNISSLQKQLASIRNDDSEEANARRSQLTKSLRDAQKDLQDTQYDRWLSDQSDMLDDLFNRYNTYVDNKISDIDTMFEDLKVQLLNQGNTINNTISTEMDRVAYQMLQESQEVLSVWSLLNGNVEGVANSVNSNGEFIGNELYGIGVTASDALANQELYGDQLVDALNDTKDNDPFFQNIGKQLQPIIGTYQSGLKNVNDSLATINAFFSTYFENLTGVITTGNGMNSFLPSVVDIVDRIVNPDKYKPVEADPSEPQPTPTTSSNNSSAKSDTLALAKTKIREYLDKYPKKTHYSPSELDSPRYSVLDRYLGIMYNIPVTKSDVSNEVKDKIQSLISVYAGKSLSSPVQILDWLKNNGFAKGGTIGRAIDKSGEDGFVLARTGEEILSIPKLKLANEMVSKLIQTSFAIPKSNVGNISKIDIGAVTFTVENMNLPNVKDADDFSREFVTVLQNDNNVQKAIRSVTTDLLSGKNSLNVKRF